MRFGIASSKTSNREISMSFLSTIFLGLLAGVLIGLFLCVQIAGVYVVWQFLKDVFHRSR